VKLVSEGELEEEIEHADEYKQGIYRVQVGRPNQTGVLFRTGSSFANRSMVLPSALLTSAGRCAFSGQMISSEAIETTLASFSCELHRQVLWYNQVMSVVDNSKCKSAVLMHWQGRVLTLVRTATSGWSVRLTGSLTCNQFLLEGFQKGIQSFHPIPCGSRAEFIVSSSS
jgi:hypothetical protein